MVLMFNGRNRVTQEYKTGRVHDGIDIVGDDDRTIHAVSDGTVWLSQAWDGVTKKGSQSYGNLIVLRDTSDRYVYYAHMRDQPTLKSGQAVKQGDIIGIMGNTGNSVGAHIHFEVRNSTRKTILDPAEYLGILNKRGTYIYEMNKNGWKWESQGWYYYKNGVVLKSQWLKDSGFWYYLTSTGKMATGWIELDGKKYWLNTTTYGSIPIGAMLLTNTSGEVLL